MSDEQACTAFEAEARSHCEIQPRSTAMMASNGSMMLSSTSTPTALTDSDIEIATRAADHFTRLYYKAYDSPTRTEDLPKFYRSTSTLTWNGTPYQGAAGVKELIENMPATKHEVQSYDCHAIPGTQPPSLLVTVSGMVTHGRGPPANPGPGRNVTGQPRVFSQTFMLVPDSTAPPTKPGEVAMYFVNADAMRFVG